ncbi:MAG: N-acetyl-gamma-glutamyl-phosphate reductase [Candidatus Binatia bacterium]
MAGETLVRVAVVGATGYTGCEIVRLLARHPKVSVSAVTSERDAGLRLGRVRPSLDLVDLELQKADAAAVAACSDFAFVALPHGSSAPLVSELVSKGVKVVDLGADFRFDDLSTYEEWYGSHPAPDLASQAVYGLSEYARDEVASASLVANPGCYPTGALLALLPLASELAGPVIVDSKSGTSGAGRGASEQGLFAEVNEEIRPYSVGRHRHGPEIVEKLGAKTPKRVEVLFAPQLIPVSRGLLTHCYVKLARDVDVESVFKRAYDGEAFVRVLAGEELPSIRRVRGTNMAELAWFHDEASGQLLVMTAIDNLGKGAAGQAVQNMNIMLGLGETSGLDQLAAMP